MEGAPAARRWACAFARVLPLLALGTSCNWSVPSEPWEPAPGPALAAPIAPREPCATRDPARRAFFGDLHVHTSFSMDARAMGTTRTPDEA